MKAEFKMTQADLDTIKEASKAVMYIVFDGQEPRPPQQNVNAAWAALGRKMGFKLMTVEALPSKGERFFLAEANQTRTADQRYRRR